MKVIKQLKLTKLKLTRRFCLFRKLNVAFVFLIMQIGDSSNYGLHPPPPSSYASMKKY